MNMPFVGDNSMVFATKKMPALSTGERAKEKAEPGTRIASRLSLVEATGLEPAASWSQTKHSTKLSYASKQIHSLGCVDYYTQLSRKCQCRKNHLTGSFCRLYNDVLQRQIK